MSDHRATDQAAPQAVSFWRSVVQALRGEHHDYTSERLNRAVILLAVPMVLEMLMESLFAVVDIFWVGHLGSAAVAVVGVTENLMILLYAVAIGISIAATAIVARRIGEKDPERAARAAGQILIMGATVSIVLGIVLAIFADKILRLMGVEEHIVQLGANFARVMLGGNLTVFMIFLINAVFRGAGDAVIAMRTLWLANGINLVLSPCFIFGWGPFPELGIVGAAVGTNIGRGIGVAYQLWHLFGNRSSVPVRLHHLRPDFTLIRSILRTAGTGILQFLISTTSWLGLTVILTKFHEDALAGNTFAVRVIVFALMPAWGLANAGATLVGQNLGAKKPERAQQAVWIATRYNMIFLGIVGLVFVAFAEPIMRIFATKPEVVAHGTAALFITGLAFPMYAAGMCFESAFNGAGDTWTPTRVNFVCFWVLQVPLAYFLAITCNLGPKGVFISVPIAFSTMAVTAAILFQRGKWKLKQV